jgi:putative molybdopterin biosynthesis protein
VIGKLVTFDEAKHVVENNFKPQSLDTEEIVLLEAYNRVLGIDIIAPMDIPGFNISVVEGYALSAQDTTTATEDNPTAFKVEGTVVAGEHPRFKLSHREAAEVLAGAVLPQGADAVIATQDGQRADSILQVFVQVSQGENVRQIGIDIQKGTIVLRKGQVLGSAEIGVLAALGFTQVTVFRIPMVAVFSVGAEIGELGKPLPPGKTFDATTYSICTTVMECGAKPVCLGAVPDGKETIMRMLQTATSAADMVVVCSSTDIAEITDALGKPGVVVKGIAVKPGRQTTVSFTGEKPVFILPSNPSAALLMFQLFARSLVQRLGGRPVLGLKTVMAYTGSKMFSAKGSRTYVLVQLNFDEKCRLIADPLKAVGAVSTLASAVGFVEIPENQQYIDVDQEVVVTLFRGLANNS